MDACPRTFRPACETSGTTPALDAITSKKRIQWARGRRTNEQYWGSPGTRPPARGWHAAFPGGASLPLAREASRRADVVPDVSGGETGNAGGQAELEREDDDLKPVDVPRAA